LALVAQVVLLKQQQIQMEILVLLVVTQLLDRI